jgi:spermidine/putrescine-binding protein
MAQAYNGESLAANGRTPEIGLLNPMEGSSLWMDNLVMLESSKKQRPCL